MKSNSNEARAAVRKYIINTMDLSGYDQPNTAANLFKIFESEFVCDYNRRLFKTTQNMFIEWLKGSPSSFPVELFFDEVRRILIEDFKTNTPAKRDDNKSLDFFLSLIYMELKRMQAEPHKESEKMLNKIAKTFK